jgi:long-chain fatty acid transport protein
MMLHRASRFTLAIVLLGLPAAAGAQAFGLNEIGTCALSRGFAATAAPCDDASSIYWNPGAMPKQRGFSLYGGVALIRLNGEFVQDTTGIEYESDIPTAAVPHLFLNYRTSGKSAFGLGVYVPYGLTSQWKDDFPGRFAAKKASLQTIYVQPNFSYQLTDNWSVGGGPVFGHSTVELIQALDASSAIVILPKRTEFGRAALKGSATAFGVNLGVHGKLTPEWDMGVRFLSQVTFSYDDADATFTQTPTGYVFAGPVPGTPIVAGTKLDDLLAPQFAAGGPFVAQKVSTSIQHPAQVQVGFAYSGFPNTTLSAEYAYVGWKSFKALPVNFQGPAASRSRVLQEDYNNTSSIRLGVDRRLQSGIALRGGFTAAAAAAPDETVTPLLPEQDRALAMIGAGLPVGKRFTIDASFAHIFTPGRRGRLDERAPGSTAAQAIALNEGSYTLSANIFALSLKANY